MTSVIELRRVCKQYPHFQLSDLDLDLEQGSIMGFIGPNGSGKSTTMRLLMGLIQADSGSVRVLGHEIPKDVVAAKREIGFASEDLRLYEKATLDWHMRFVGQAFPQWDADYASSLLKKFDLHADQTIKGMSHGQRVKSGLLLVLARRPKLLLLDEPTTGLDPVARSEVLDELVEVLHDEERSVLFSSHNTADIEQICDRITFIDRGHLVETNDKEHFLDSWQRIRFEADIQLAADAIPNTVSISQNGRLGTLVLNAETGGLESIIQGAGARVVAIERMNLEEIFVTAVKASRQEEAA